jgi:hypothetical protein
VVEAPAAAPNVWTGRWKQGLSLIGEWDGQYILLPHTKVQEWMGYSGPCRKRDGGLLSLTWSRSCMPAWQLAGFQPQSRSCMPAWKLGRFKPRSRSGMPV